MKEVKLINGIKKVYKTAENDTWEFYYGSGIATDADILKRTFDKQKKYCEIDLHRIYGWFVRVKK